MMKRVLAVAVVAVALTVSGFASPTRVHRAPPPRFLGPGYAFVSMPDFLNNDLADVSSSRFWRAGDPNSINAAYRTAITTTLNDVDTEPGDDVLVAGDLVGGRWGRDDAGTGIFGPVDTEAHKVEAVKRAATTYFTAVARRFSRGGLNLYPALGDHDIGDNPWDVSKGGWYRFKHDHVPVWKRAWAQRFTLAGARFRRHPVGTAFDDTAYAVHLAPRVLLVSVDVFNRIAAG